MDSSLKDVFTKIKKENHWRDEDSVSGTGSNMSQTDTIRKVLPEILRKYNIGHMIDAPCGDFYWMKEISSELEDILNKYEGYDIVEEIVNLNTSLYASEKLYFKVCDITSDLIPKADLIFTRDCLVHLSFKNIHNVIKNYKKAGIKYLLTTTFTNRTNNFDIENGEWRPLNLEKPPFNFPKPILIINENCTEENGIYSDKCLALWEINNLPNSKLNLFIKRLMDKF